MAKEKEIKPKKITITKVKDCANCNGNPAKSPFTAEPFKGEKCESCFRILNYERI